ncbi:hypothetical protein [uncultured Methanobrevibacter sp.]|uniref:hypothetical protein n=1 Tax=uncultured Methanobrevibacter sp. TaxID=253161 RepID=UPI00260F7638|nr:hypothetical protein [uncultured Methanobrevibacter sp.]
MNAILAAILSFIIPGLGQAVSGDIKKGVIFFVIAVIMGIIALFIFQSWVVNIINLAIAVYAAYDAYQMNA